jgi:hypothetical protein
LNASKNKIELTKEAQFLGDIPWLNIVLLHGNPCTGLTFFFCFLLFHSSCSSAFYFASFSAFSLLGDIPWLNIVLLRGNPCTGLTLFFCLYLFCVRSAYRFAFAFRLHFRTLPPLCFLVNLSL